MATEQSEKVRENRLRAMAGRQGRELHKSRRRDPYALDYGHWTLIDRDGTEHTGLDLDAVEVYLTDVPRIEVELKRLGPAYIENRGANRDLLGPVVREARTLGLPLEAIAHVSTVPLLDITALNRDAQDGA